MTRRADAVAEVEDAAESYGPTAQLDTLAGGPAARSAGIELLAAEPGSAHLRMTVTPAMLNAYGLCHGGYLFLFADTAFGVAANAHGRRSLALHAEIVFTAAVREGSVLDAWAVELVRYGTEQRHGIYDVRVTDADGSVVAQFRGAITAVG